MQNRIPLPNPNNFKMFDDVFEYLKDIRNRQAIQQTAGQKLEEDKRQFGISNALEQQKAGETANYHNQALALKMQELQQKVGNGGRILSPQERTQKMKLLESARGAMSIVNKTNELEEILTENPHLTGWVPHLMNAIGKGGEKLGRFTTTTGDLQALIGKLASQRGGAQIIKWAEKMKPSDWKDVVTNLGHVRGLRETTSQDFTDIADEYETITGEKFPLKLPPLQGNSENPPGTTVMHKNGKDFHIPDAEVAEAEAAGYTKK